MGADESIRSAQRVVLDDPSDDAAWNVLVDAALASGEGVGFEPLVARVAWLVAQAGGGRALARMLSGGVRGVSSGTSGPWYVAWFADKPGDEPAGTPSERDVAAGLEFAARGVPQPALAASISRTALHGVVSDAVMMDLHGLARSAAERHAQAIVDGRTAARADYGYTLTPDHASWFGVSYHPPVSGVVTQRLEGLSARIMAANFAQPPGAPQFSNSRPVHTRAATTQQAAGVAWSDATGAGSADSWSYWQIMNADAFLGAIRRPETSDLFLIRGEALSEAFRSMDRQWGFKDRIFAVILAAASRPTILTRIPHADASKIDSARVEAAIP